MSWRPVVADVKILLRFFISIKIRNTAWVIILLTAVLRGSTIIFRPNNRRIALIATRITLLILCGEPDLRIMLRHDIRFAHKNYGRQGSEFVIEHPQLHIFRMLYSTPLVTFVAYLLNLSEWVNGSLNFVCFLYLPLSLSKTFHLN